MGRAHPERDQQIIATLAPFLQYVPTTKLESSKNFISSLKRDFIAKKLLSQVKKFNQDFAHFQAVYGTKVGRIQSPEPNRL